VKITPLVLHAAMRVPALTDAFSDTLSANALTVLAGGLTTITAPGHGLPGEPVGIAIVDALAPNAIVSATLLANGDVVITTRYDHGFAFVDDAHTNAARDSFVQMSGWGRAALDGQIQLIAVKSRRAVIVRPQGTVLAPLTVPASATVLERLDGSLIGWHVATPSGPDTLTMPTPVGIDRDYVVPTPKIAVSIRAWGCLDIDLVRRELGWISEKEAGDRHVKPDRSYLFIAPLGDVRVSRDKRAGSDVMAEFSPHTFNSQTLDDGFICYAVLPAENYGGAVGCVDRAHGELLAAMLGCFNGLSLPRSELAGISDLVAVITGHHSQYYDGSTYIHAYTFTAPAYITNADACEPWAWAQIAAQEAALQTPGLPTIVGAAIASITTQAVIPPGGISFGAAPAPELPSAQVPAGVAAAGRPQLLTT
jgi:hypothetical protein